LRPRNIRRAAGAHVVRWDATAMSSGVYYAIFRSQNYVQTRKLVLLK
jgi:hypothetical protein